MTMDSARMALRHSLQKNSGKASAYSGDYRKGLLVKACKASFAQRLDEAPLSGQVVASALNRKMAARAPGILNYGRKHDTIRGKTA